MGFVYLTGHTQPQDGLTHLGGGGGGVKYNVGFVYLTAYTAAGWTHTPGGEGSKV